MKLYTIVVDAETIGGYRVIRDFPMTAESFVEATKKLQSRWPLVLKNAVQFIDKDSGETEKGPKHDTTTQEVRPYGDDVRRHLNKGVKQSNPLEPTQHEPRDRFQESKNMKNNIISKLVKECLAEAKAKKEALLKKSLRNVIKEVLMEGSAINNNVPEKDKEEKEKESKGYKKDGSEMLEKNNYKLLDELEKLAHGIDPNIKVYWDDYNQLRVDNKNRFEVRIKPMFEDNFNVEAMVKLEDRVYAIGLTWEQVKEFVKANFSDFKDQRSVEVAKKKALDHYKDNEVIKKDAGPEGQKLKVRYQDPDHGSVKDTKNDEKNYNKKDVEKDEDQPDQPMKQVTEPGKDPESKNKNIEKTDKVKPPKHKNDKKLVVKDKKTPKHK